MQVRHLIAACCPVRVGGSSTRRAKLPASFRSTYPVPIRPIGSTARHNAWPYMHALGGLVACSRGSQSCPRAGGSDRLGCPCCGPGCQRSNGLHYKDWRKVPPRRLFVALAQPHSDKALPRRDRLRRVQELPAAGAEVAPTPAKPLVPAENHKTPSAPARSERCQATTKKGTQCLRKTKAGAAYCWQHR
jgi:hypothetical protein